MKIKYNRVPNERIFSHLIPGDVFSWGDNLFMVLDYGCDDNVNAVNLENYRLECLDATDKCIKMDCTLIINN